MELSHRAWQRYVISYRLSYLYGLKMFYSVKKYNETGLNTPLGHDPPSTFGRPPTPFLLNSEEGVDVPPLASHRNTKWATAKKQWSFHPHKIWILYASRNQNSHCTEEQTPFRFFPSSTIKQILWRVSSQLYYELNSIWALAHKLIWSSVIHYVSISPPRTTRAHGWDLTVHGAC